MMSLSGGKQASVIDAFNTTSRYLDEILNINNVYFDTMVSQIYPSELRKSDATTWRYVHVNVMSHIKQIQNGGTETM